MECSLEMLISTMNLEIGNFEWKFFLLRSVETNGIFWWMEFVCDGIFYTNFEKSIAIDMLGYFYMEYFLEMLISTMNLEIGYFKWKFLVLWFIETNKFVKWMEFVCDGILHTILK